MDHLTHNNNHHFNLYKNYQSRDRQNSLNQTDLLTILGEPLTDLPNKKNIFLYEFISEIFADFIHSEWRLQANELNTDIIKMYALKASKSADTRSICLKDLKSIAYVFRERINSKLKKYDNSFRQYIEVEHPIWQEIGKLSLHLEEHNVREEKPFVFLATYSTRINYFGKTIDMPLADLLSISEARNQSYISIRALKSLNQLAGKIDLIRRLRDSRKIFKACTLSEDEANLLVDNIDELKHHDAGIHLPKKLRHAKLDTAELYINGCHVEGKKNLGFESKIRFQVGAKIKNSEIEEGSIHRFTVPGRRVVYYKENWLEIKTNNISNILNDKFGHQILEDGINFTQASWIMAGLHPKIRAASEEDIALIDTRYSLCKTLQPILRNQSQYPCSKSIESVEPNLKEAFIGRLRPYQLEGVKWLVFLRSFNLGGCLADDMGLGKTVQIIAFLVHEKNRNPKVNPSLILVPTSLLINWHKELNKFAPTLRVVIAHPSYMNGSEINLLYQNLETVDVVIGSYSASSSIKWLPKIHWNALIVDEAQAIKNPNAIRSRQIKKINANARFALTGTPIENNLKDLWSIFDFSSRPLLGNLRQFSELCETLKLSNNHDPIKKIIAPYFIRRSKTDKSIISDLPEKTELKVYCKLSETQIQLYDDFTAVLKEKLKSNLSNHLQRYVFIANSLHSFKMICNHPSSADENSCYSLMDSGKLLRLKTLLGDIYTMGDKCIIFTQYRKMVDILNEFVQVTFGKKGYSITGSCPVKERAKILSLFQQDESPTCLMFDDNYFCMLTTITNYNSA